MVSGHVKKRDQHRTVKKKKNSRCQTDSAERVYACGVLLTASRGCASDFVNTDFE